MSAMHAPDIMAVGLNTDADVAIAEGHNPSVVRIAVVGGRLPIAGRMCIREIGCVYCHPRIRNAIRNAVVNNGYEFLL